MASNVNRILMRAVGGIELGGIELVGAENALYIRFKYLELHQKSTGRCKNIPNTTEWLHDGPSIRSDDRAEISMFSVWRHIKHALNTAQRVALHGLCTF